MERPSWLLVAAESIKPQFWGPGKKFTCCGVMKWSESRSVVSSSLQPHALYSPWSSPGKNTGVVSLFLLQGIFPTQGSNPGLPHCGRILYQLSHKGSPRILEWVANPFSSGSSQPRNGTRSSCIENGYFTELSRKPHLFTYPIIYLISVWSHRYLFYTSDYEVKCSHSVVFNSLQPHEL